MILKYTLLVEARNFFNNDTRVSVVAAGSGWQALFEYYKVLDRGIFRREQEWTPIPRKILTEDVILFLDEIDVKCNP